MNRSKRLKRTVLAAGLLLLLVVAALFLKLAPHPIVRCYLVRWSNLDRLAPNLYIDPHMPESQREQLLSSLADARERIVALYGAYSAEPIIIAGHTMEVMSAYGGNTYNRAGKAYLTPIAAFIVLGPEGVRSRDVLAHELGHVELWARVGYGNRGRVPNWFDEGLAGQFDGRYTEAAWQLRTDGGRTAPDLEQMGIIEHDDWLGYATAKHEVARWLEVVGRDSLEALLHAIRSGEDFRETYHSLEQVQATTQ